MIQGELWKNNQWYTILFSFPQRFVIDVYVCVTLILGTHTLDETIDGAKEFAPANERGTTKTEICTILMCLSVVMIMNKKIMRKRGNI